MFDLLFNVSQTPKPLYTAQYRADHLDSWLSSTLGYISSEDVPLGTIMPVSTAVHEKISNLIPRQVAEAELGSSAEIIDSTSLTQRWHSHSRTLLTSDSGASGNDQDLDLEGRHPTHASRLQRPHRTRDKIHHDRPAGLVSQAAISYDLGDTWSIRSSQQCSEIYLLRPSPLPGGYNAPLPPSCLSV